MMTALTRTRMNPIAEMLSWLDAPAPWGSPRVGLSPYIRVEDYVEDGSYVLRAEVPGIDPEKDLQIELLDDVLTISYERTDENQERNLSEFRYGSFQRTIPLPSGTNTEEVKARYVNGVLEVRVPFRNETPEAQRIPVTWDKSE